MFHKRILFDFYLQKSASTTTSSTNRISSGTTGVTPCVGVKTPRSDTTGVRKGQLQGGGGSRGGGGLVRRV